MDRSLFARQGGESLQPGHSRSERSNSSDTDFEGQIWHRQSGHSGTGTCCTTLPRRPPPVGVDRKDASSPTTFRLATFWRATFATTETPSHRHSMAIQSQWRRQGGKRSHATHNPEIRELRLVWHMETCHKLRKQPAHVRDSKPNLSVSGECILVF